MDATKEPQPTQQKLRLNEEWYIYAAKIIQKKPENVAKTDELMEYWKNI
jgi:hypothetical protein